MPLTNEEATQLLTSLPAVERIAVGQLHPDDVLVVECDHAVSSQEGENIQAAMHRVWPDRKVLVFPKGYRLRIVAPADLPGYPGELPADDRQDGAGFHHDGARAAEGD